MQHLESSGTPVLYIGHTVLKGYIKCIQSVSALVMLNVIVLSQVTLNTRHSPFCD